MKRLITLVIASAVVVAACSGNGATTLSAEEEAVAVALEARMAEEVGSDSEDPLGDAEARLCFARGLVAEVGIARLAELGVTAAGVDESDEVFGAMSDSELEAAAGIAAGCIDLAASFEAELVSSGVSASSASCLVDRLDGSDFFARAFLTGMAGGEPDPSVISDLIAAASACLTPEELGIFLGDS
jgi:hypothetical protein